MIRDFVVGLRHEAEIADYARRLRELSAIEHRLPIDPTIAVGFLKERELPRKGRLRLCVSDHTHEQYPAFVTFEPLTLSLDCELWNLALEGEAYSRFVVAHELGHIILHDKYAQPFSGKSSDFSAKSFQEKSAEWQADTFAYHFMAPDDLAASCFDTLELANAANLEPRRAEAILSSLNRRKLWSKAEQLGEACRFCLNFSVSQNRSSSKCSSCGARTYF